MAIIGRAGDASHSFAFRGNFRRKRFADYDASARGMAFQRGAIPRLPPTDYSSLAGPSDTIYGHRR